MLYTISSRNSLLSGYSMICGSFSMSTHSKTKETSCSLQYAFSSSRCSGDTFRRTISWKYPAYWLSMVDLLARNSPSSYSL